MTANLCLYTCDSKVFEVDRSLSVNLDKHSSGAHDSMYAHRPGHLVRVCVLQAELF